VLVIRVTILFVVVVVIMEVVVVIVIIVVVVVETLEAARELVNNKSHKTLYEIMTIFHLTWNL